jgi:hypothetical protein
LDDNRDQRGDWRVAGGLRLVGAGSRLARGWLEGGLRPGKIVPRMFGDVT